MQRTLLILVFLAAAASARAGNTFQFFFGIDNDIFNTIDDEIEVRTIYWDNAFQPVDWVLIKPNNGPVLLPITNLNNISDTQVLELCTRSLREWNNSPISDFDFEDDVFFSSGPGSGAVPDPKPVDALLDGHNSITFQSTVFQLDAGVIALCSTYFLENDIELEEFEGVPIDEVEGTVLLPLDLDLDGFADLTLPARNYSRAEIIETDVVFNSAFTFFDWPVDPDDINPIDLPLLPNSIDIQAVLTHEIGHALGAGHSWLQAPVMTPFYGGVDFPANPYDRRQLKYDDYLAAGLIYPDFGSSGTIAGWLIDGQSAEIYKELLEADPLLDLETIDPAINDLLFVVQQPVFVGHPAPPGLHPDNIPSEEGEMRMIGQVLTGEDLLYPAASGGALMFPDGLPIEPGIAVDVNIDFTDVGEDIDQDGIIDLGEDINANGVLDPTTRDIDSKFRFPGLAPREDYVVWIDQNFEGVGPIAISNVNLFLSAFETFIAEFYGGTGVFSEFIDDNTGDEELVPEFISVTDGAVHDIVIITNTESTTDPETPPDGDPTGVLKFVEDKDAFTTTTYVGQSGDLGDINGDGYLDLIVAVFTGGEDVGGGAFNRLLLNVPKDPLNPGGARKFQDISFGPDNLAGSADDVLPAHIDNSRDAKFGDFNGDGHLDIFVSNAADPNSSVLFGGFPRLYIWEEFLANPWGFRYLDVSESTMPGLLNRGYDPTTPQAAAPFLFGDGRSDGSRAVVGDIDGDGDLDIIVSLFTPANDEAPGLQATAAMVDVSPNTEENPFGDFMLTLVAGEGQEADLVTEYLGPINSRFDAVDLYTSGGLSFLAGALVFTEQVLVNKLVDATSPGFYFVDETLGADNRFGDSTRTIFGGDGTYGGGFADLFATTNADRMPPVFPPMYNLDDQLQNGVLQDSPQAYRAFEPRLGPVYGWDSIDLISARAFTDANTGDAVNLAEQAIFKNIDINSDAIPDGYYVCVNYGMDFFEGRPASGLYPVRQILGGTSVTLESAPLLVAIPDGLLADVEGDGVPPERNLFGARNQAGFTAGIGDWEYRGSPKPMFVSDNQFGPPFIFKPILLQGDMGAMRGQDGLVTGAGNWYQSMSGALQINFPRDAGGNSINALSSLPAFAGEPHGTGIADFDLDGDMDVTFANSVVLGFSQTGLVFLVDNPASDAIMTNNGFGTFSNVTATAFPEVDLFNLPTISFQALPGDVDNDGDKDIVFINALTGHDLYVNKAYDFTRPILLETSQDPTLFQDQTPLFIPPAFDGTLAPPFIISVLSGITTSVDSGDFNHDGLPDFTLAEGGIFSQGEWPGVQINAGPKRQSPFRPFNDAIQHLQPIGAPQPGPRVVPSSSYNGINGYLFDEIGAYYGVIAGDFSGDGTADLFFSRNDNGPIAFLNIDGSFAAAILGSPEADINASPDLDIDPDGIFLNLGGPDIATLGLPPLLPALADPCPDPSGSTILKNLGRRSAAADFNNDGSLDVYICNGVENSGAPNVLLLNFPVTLFPFPIPVPRFFDMTETNLPTVLGECGLPEGISDDSYHAAAADFDHDGDVDIIVANRTITGGVVGGFVGFRYLENDGTAVFADTNLVDGNLPEFLDTNPRYVLIGDFDGVGEPSEDVNGNGFLDPGEDANGNSTIDFTDLPDETAGGDANGDGIITKRTPGVWEPSFDLFITFHNHTEALLINDPTNTTPGVFSDESALRLPPFPLDGTVLLESNGARAGDVDEDGDLDIVVAKKTLNSLSRPVRLYLNDGSGIFTDNAYEFPFPKSVKGFGENEATFTPLTPSFTGNANDLELVDVDLDGDLDVYVGMAGRFDSFMTLGALDVFYVNRLHGENYNATQVALDVLYPPAPAQNPPVVFAADPDTGFQGTLGLSVDVIGSRFEFSPNTTFSFGAGITVNNVTYINPNLMKVDLNIAPAAAVGPRAVAVQNPSSGLGTTSATGIFHVDDEEENDAETWMNYD